MKKLLLPVLLLCGHLLPAQTTVFFQGFESASPNCSENWGYTGGNRNTETSRSGSYSARVGRSGESNTLTFEAVTISGLTGVQLHIFHSAQSGSAGLDTREGAAIHVSLNGGAWTFIGGVGGFSNASWGWSAIGGSASSSSGCNVYQLPNPFVYNVPAGTNTLSVRVVSVTHGSNCNTFNNNMNNGTASNYDRTDEGFFIDDISLTTTSSTITSRWTGEVSTDWFNCLNWHNHVVPTASTPAVINQTASNSCVIASGNAVCSSLEISSSNNVNRSLTLQSTGSLLTDGDITIRKTAGTGTPMLDLTGNSTLQCHNLTVTGTAQGAENAMFRNAMGNTQVTLTGNLVLNPGASLTLAGAPGGKIHLQGNYHALGRQSDIKHSGSHFYFEGSSNQGLQSNGFTVLFGHITLQKTDGILQLNTSTEVTGSFTFENGIVESQASALLIFADDATTYDASHQSHVNGPVRKVGNESFIFPIGDGTAYRPAGISAPALVSDHFTAQYLHADPDPTYSDNSKDVTLDHISSCEYWIIEQSGGSSAVEVSLSWDTQSCGVDALNDLRIARWDGSTWRDEGNGGTSGDASAGSLSSGAPISTFSPFTLASAFSSNPLPLELIYFEVEKKVEGAHLYWQTASERQTDYFLVERSGDGIHYWPIVRLSAAGFSNSVLTYEAFDQAPLPGIGFYRLKMVDTDGTFSYSTIKTLDFNATSANLSLSYLPGAIQVSGAEENETLSLEIIDISGKPVYYSTSAFPFVFGYHSLSSGIYLARVRSGSRYLHAKFAVNP